MLAEAYELYIEEQILKLFGYIIQKKIYAPLLHVIMTSKTNIAYNHVFNFLIQIMDDNNIDCNFPNKIITTDYEKALRNSIKKLLKSKILRGCFFHYSKAIWKKCREYGLTIKKFREESTIFTFCLNIICKLGLYNLVFCSGTMNNFSYKQFLLFIKNDEWYGWF